LEEKGKLCGCLTWAAAERPVEMEMEKWKCGNWELGTRNWR